VAGRLSFDGGADAYDRLVGRWSRLWVPSLVRAAALRPGDRVLDVAAGTGAATLAALQAVARAGRVHAADISLPMLRVARAATASARMAAADAQALPYRDSVFDAALCQLGLMFFPDLGQGLAEIHRVLRRGGRFAACVWAQAERVPFFGGLAEALSRQRPEQRAVFGLQFSLGEPDRLASALAGAGFRDVRVARESRPVVFASFAEYIEPVAAGAGRLGHGYRELDDTGRAAADEHLRRLFAPFTRADGVIHTMAEMVVASART
jgi:ubiquinone/menaquinone biosynthesis C-methylase UbiE